MEPGGDTTPVKGKLKSSRDTTGPNQLNLEHPKTDAVSLLRHFGPGMVLMMTGIGTSHLVTAPTAGGRFEYALLWCIPVAYIFKYYGFEMAFRFTQSTGKSLIDAYGTAWKKWPLWYVLIVTVVQSAVGQAGRLIAASAVIHYSALLVLGISLPLAVYGLALGLISVVVLLAGSYRALENVAKALAGILVASTLVVYFLKPAPLSVLEQVFRPEAPEGSSLIIAALLGLLPTGIDVSLQASEWGSAKRCGLAKIRGRFEESGDVAAFDPFTGNKKDLAVRISDLPSEAREYCAVWFRICLWDFRLGHCISFLLAAAFLILSAMWVYPSSLEGTEVMAEISRMFTNSIGPSSAAVFLIGAFAATFSTAFNYFDGWPRLVGACCRNIFRSTATLRGIDRKRLTAEHRSSWYSEFNIYRATMIFSLVSAVAIMAGLPRPVLLVLVSSAMAFVFAPIIYVLNVYYCLTVIPKDQHGYYPSRFAIWFSLLSLVVFTVLAAILIASRVFGVRVLG
jgi:Mn2+/Fe2+ NRAMP family transporter